MDYLVYHGSNFNFLTFKKGIVYFAETLEEAQAYGGRIAQARIRVKKPYRPRDTNTLLFPDEALVKKLIGKGYDCIAGEYLSGATEAEEKIWAVFHSKQIKIIKWFEVTSLPKLRPSGGPFAPFGSPQP